MSPTSKGIALTQISSGSVGSSGSLSIGNLQLKIGAIGSVPVNLSTDPSSSRDWFAYITQGGTFDWSNPSATGRHSKLLGGWLWRNFQYWGPSGTLTFTNQTNSVFAITTALGDDDCVGQTRLLNFVNASPNFTILTANNTLAFSNWGFKVAFLGGTNLRTGRVYFCFQSGGVAVNNSVQITAAAMDGSTGTKSFTVTPGSITKSFYSIDFTFRTFSEGVPVVAVFNVIQNSADSGTQIGFQAVGQN